MAISPELLAEEDCGENVAMSVGIGLEVSRPPSGPRGEAHQPQHQRREGTDEQKHFEPLGASGSGVSQSEPPSVIFQVSEGFFDLHALGVGSHDCIGVSGGVRQGGREEPGRAVELSVQPIIGSVAFSLFWSSGAAMVSAHEIQSTPVFMALGEAAPADVPSSLRGIGVEGVDKAPATGFGAEVLDGVANSPDPIPSQGLYRSEPWSAEACVGDDDGTHMLGQHVVESGEELTVSLGAIVSTHRVDFFVDGHSSPTHGNRCLEDEQPALEFAVGPIDDDERSVDMGEQGVGDLGVDIDSLAMQMRVAEQPVHRFDVVLDERAAFPATAEMCESELPAVEQCFDHSKQRIEPCPVADDVVAFEPSFQQANRVHAVLSDVDDCVATTIRSDDSMHVDPLSNCIPSIYGQNSWGYLSKALQRTRINLGCFPWLLVRAAELGLYGPP